MRWYLIVLWGCMWQKGWEPLLFYTLLSIIIKSNLNVDGPFDLILGGLRQHYKQRCIINNFYHIKHTIIWIKLTLCQLEQIGRKRRRGAVLFFFFTANCAFVIFHDLSVCLFRGSPDSKINWPEWWSFEWVVTASCGRSKLNPAVSSSCFVAAFMGPLNHCSNLPICYFCPQANRHVLRRNLTVGDPLTSVSRCHGDVTGRRTAKMVRMRRTVPLVSLSKSGVGSLL